MTACTTARRRGRRGPTRRSSCWRASGTPSGWAICGGSPTCATRAEEVSASPGRHEGEARGSVRHGREGVGGRGWLDVRERSWKWENKGKGERERKEEG